MEPVPELGAEPVGQPVAGPLGVVPTTMEDHRECARESMTLMDSHTEQGTPKGPYGLAVTWRCSLMTTRKASAQEFPLAL